MILENEVKEITEEELTGTEVVVPKKTTRKKKAIPSLEQVKTQEETEDNFEAYLDTWKAQYKRIFKNEIDGEVIIWRRLKRGEYKEILKADIEEEEDKILTKQELMVKTAILYPFDVDTLIDENAGLATVLSEEILAKSGFAISYTEEL